MSDFYLVTGFLGAGKTTFLKNFIREFSDQRVHLIVNEFGKEGIDGSLLRELDQTLDEINNGSIFCSCRLDKFEEVLEKTVQNSPDVIIVEASGLSNPTNVKKILAQPDKFPSIHYKGSLCLVDALQFPKVYETATVVKKQIAISDIVIINKVDLVEKEQLETVKTVIASHRPDMPIVETSYGKIDRSWMNLLIQPELIPEKMEIQNMDITLRKYQIHISKNGTYYELQKMIQMFIDDTYRIKGFVQLENQKFFIDCVGNLFKGEKYQGEVAHGNVLVVLSGNGLPARKSIKKAMEWYPDLIQEVEWE